ncbi:MAG: DNA repair protein RecO [Lachnospiraceae bacterium]|nr:DNA repair protein RecO [Lachnospiraceae bacterium]
MRDTVTVTGMIVQSSPIREYDRRVELLTKELGRISAFARGARRPNSALCASTVLFTFGEYQLYEGRDSYTLSAGSIKNQFAALAEDYDALCYCSYFAEMARYFTRENLEAAQELLLLYVTIRAVMAEKQPLPLIRLVYELRLMQIEGEMLEFFQCLSCGNTGIYTVYLAAGGLVCDSCAKQDPRLKQISPIWLSGDALYTIQYILTSDLERLFAFQIPDVVLAELNQFRNRYFAKYLPHRFSTMDFLE